MNQERIYTIIDSPVVSEKTVNLTQDQQTYAFRVDKTATKVEIKQAIEHLFEVKVVSVQVLNQTGKTVRHRGRLGKRNNTRKAYIRLAEGQSIDIEVI